TASNRTKVNKNKLGHFEAQYTLKAPFSCAIASNIIYSCGETDRHYSYVHFHPNITKYSAMAFSTEKHFYHMMCYYFHSLLMISRRAGDEVPARARQEGITPLSC